MKPEEKVEGSRSRLGLPTLATWRQGRSRLKLRQEARIRLEEERLVERRPSTGQRHPRSERDDPNPAAIRPAAQALIPGMCQAGQAWLLFAGAMRGEGRACREAGRE